MKKTYITPTAAQVDLLAEAALLSGSGQSLTINEEGSAAQWSQKKEGWNSESWDGAEE